MKSGLDSGNPSKVREKPTIKEEGKCGWRVGGNFILSCDRGEIQGGPSGQKAKLGYV